MSWWLLIALPSVAILALVWRLARQAKALGRDIHTLRELLKGSSES